MQAVKGVPDSRQKKRACQESFFAAFSLDFLCVVIWPPGAYGQKGGRYADIAGFKVDCKETGESGKTSHSTVSAGAGEVCYEYGEWQGNTAFGISGRVCALQGRKIYYSFSGT